MYYCLTITRAAHRADKMNNLSNFPQGKTQKEGVHQERTILHKNPGREGRGSKSMAVKPTDDSADQKQEQDQKRQYNANNEELAK